MQQRPEEEDEPLEMTLDEWKALHSQNERQAASNIYQSDEKKDKITWSKGTKHHNKHEDDHIPDTLRRRRRGGIGDYKRGGGHVPNENINGPDNKPPKQPVPCVDDEEDFPSLVKDGKEQRLQEANKQRCDESVEKAAPTRGTNQAWRPVTAVSETRPNRDGTEQRLQEAAKHRCDEPVRNTIPIRETKPAWRPVTAPSETRPNRDGTEQRLQEAAKHRCDEPVRNTIPIRETKPAWRPVTAPSETRPNRDGTEQRPQETAKHRYESVEKSSTKREITQGRSTIATFDETRRNRDDTEQRPQRASKQSTGKSSRARETTEGSIQTAAFTNIRPNRQKILAFHKERNTRRGKDSKEEQETKEHGDIVSREVLTQDRNHCKTSYFIKNNKQQPLDLCLLNTWEEIKDADQLIQVISSQMKQLETFLNQQKVSEDCLVALIKVVSNALDAHQKQEQIKPLLESFCRTKFFEHVMIYTKEKQISNGIWDKAQQFFMSCKKILEEILNMLPGYAKNCVIMSSDLLDAARCIESIKGNVSLLADITSLYELSKKIFLSDKKVEQKHRGRLWMSNNLEEPPEDFLDLPIVPTKMDLQEGVIPFIRCVRIEGGYKDVHEYLDVQFRLMRQDFIIPLREGIAEYKKNHCKNGFRSSHLRFYFNVRITGSIFYNGINHVLRVDDTKLHNFQQKQSKCLMFGSLLCLSKDNFETVIFATVAHDITKLDKGFIVVSFQTGLDDVFNSTSNDVFVMAETTAFFESYCHVLEGLQEMITKLPLQDYIIHCKTELKPPQYLLPSGGICRLPEYDLSSLMETKCLQTVPILTTVKWPKADVMCLNESQRAAAQLALTKELAIIQGPPGTGKTYVGLKVMQVLLENKHIMAESDQKNNDPILVVCYTNHALDQFLEGVLKFCPGGIVRVGGQSKSEKLNIFNLRNLRDKLKRENHAKRRYKAFDKSRMLEISNKMNNLNETKESLQTDIVTEHTLKSHMRNKHLNSLLYERAKFNNHDARIHEWLTTSKQTTQSILSQMIKAHLTMLVLKTKVKSKPARFSPGMKIIQRVNFYCFYLELYESEQTREVQWLLNQRQTPVNKNRMHKIQYRLKTARTQILPDHQIAMVLYEDDWEAICKYSKAAYKNVGDSSDKVIENWLLRPNQSLHLQLDDVQMLTGIKSHKDDGGALGPDYMYLKEQNDRMVDVDSSYSNKVRARVKTAVNSLMSAAKRAEALGIRDDVLMEHDVDNHEWKDVTKSTLTLRALHRKLQFIKPMTYEEEDNVKSVWDLELDKRFALYNLWVQRYKLELCAQMQELRLEYKSEQEKQKYAENMETQKLLRAAKVIGMTTSGAARNRAVLQDVGCRIIVVEEAAEVLESHIVTSLNKNCKHLILIGDHQQLRPNPTVYQLAKDFGLEMSLFERLVKNKVPHVMLKEQHRMRPEISQIMRHIYPDLQDHPSVTNYEKIRGVSKNIFFIQHEHKETHLEESMSKSNTHEAKFLVALCQYLLNQDYEASQITILATYSGQVFEIRKAMMKQNIDSKVLVTAVDNYQGEENDIILLSLVRSNTENGVGFLKVDNRVCVALSRARQGLYVIGNLNLLASQSKLWNKIVKTARSEDIIDIGLSVNCHNHPDFREFMISDQDFLKCPEGGCGRPCKRKLNCGHICDKLCHGYDLDHTKYKCLKPCPKTCDNGHPCKQKCYEECICPVLVLKQIPSCGHEGEFPCHVPVEQAVCSLRCCGIFDCGHQCAGTCGQCRVNEKHNVCNVQVEYKWPCGHTETVPCHTAKPYNGDRCKQVCGEELHCGHQCSGICGQCRVKGKHNVCTVQVEYKWPCGHTETVPCYTATPDNGDRCKQVCGEELHCDHECAGVCGKCRLNKKHNECIVQVQHQWPCGHNENVPCHTTKSKDGCKQICGTERACGHVCSGICGHCRKIGQHAKCKVPVEYKRLCGHTEEILCYQGKPLNACKNVCGQKLACGHKCAGVCGQCEKELKHERCKVPVKYRRNCGHIDKTPCHVKPSQQHPCKHVCGAELKCGHFCKGTCSECLQKIVHVACQEQCLLSLPCGHTCGGFCGIPCLPCTQICPNQCSHGSCFQNQQPPLCSHTCPPCMAKYIYSCKHLKYSRLCSNHCDIKPCAKRCNKRTLPCQHKCAGLCGELCVCGKCDTVSKIAHNSETKRDGFMAGNTESATSIKDITNRETESKIDKQINEQHRSNDKQNQRLLKLPSCGHIFYIEDLDKYVHSFGHNGSSYIPCPVCQIPILNCTRYENINKVRSRQRAAQKEKLQRETVITEKQKTDLQASQRALGVSPLVADFHLIDVGKVANIVALRAVSFQIKCAFVLNAIVSVMKNPVEATSTELLGSRQNALLSIRGRLTNQQREEFITELSRCFWLYCLSHLDSIAIPVHLKQPQDSNIDAELTLKIKALGKPNFAKDILIRAQLVSGRKNKRIQETSQAEEDRRKSLFLEQTALKVLKTLASSDDDMLCHLIERNFQDLPKPSISDRPAEATISEHGDHVRQKNHQPQLSRKEMPQAARRFTGSLLAQKKYKRKKKTRVTSDRK